MGFSLAIKVLSAVISSVFKIFAVFWMIMISYQMKKAIDLILEINSVNGLVFMQLIQYTLIRSDVEI